MGIFKIIMAIVCILLLLLMILCLFSALVISGRISRDEED